MNGSVRSSLVQLRLSAGRATWASIEQVLTGRGATDAARAVRSARRAGQAVHEQAMLATRAAEDARHLADVLSVADLLASVTDLAERLALAPHTAEPPTRLLKGGRPGETALATRIRILRSASFADPSAVDALLGAALALETAVAAAQLGGEAVTVASALGEDARAAAEAAVRNSPRDTLLDTVRIFAAVDGLTRTAERLVVIVGRTAFVVDTLAGLTSLEVVTTPPVAAVASRVGRRWVPTGPGVDDNRTDAWLVEAIPDTSLERSS
jgi:hypothetical protein